MQSPRSSAGDAISVKQCGRFCLRQAVREMQSPPSRPGDAISAKQSGRCNLPGAEAVAQRSAGGGKRAGLRPSPASRRSV
eukprot:scaffold23411_cov84-Isochrysis_galbana.AAC.1